MYKEKFVKEKNNEIYTEYQAYEEDFDIIVYDKIKKIEKNKTIERKLQNDKRKII